MRDGQADFARQGHAEQLVLDAVAQVDLLGSGNDAHGRLEDMAGRRDAARLGPLAVDPQIGRLLLRAGDGNPEILVFTKGERRGGEVLQVGDHLFFRNDAILHVLLGRCFVQGQELQRTDTVAPQHGQQREHILALRPDTRGDLFAQLAFGIGQEVVEGGDNGIALPFQPGQRQGTGNRKSGLGREPVWIIGEGDGPIRRAGQRAHPLPFVPDGCLALTCAAARACDACHPSAALGRLHGPSRTVPCRGPREGEDRHRG